jgi:hypothetical protein
MTLRGSFASKTSSEFWTQIESQRCPLMLQSSLKMPYFYRGQFSLVNFHWSKYLKKYQPPNTAPKPGLGVLKLMISLGTEASVTQGHRAGGKGKVGVPTELFLLTGSMYKPPLSPFPSTYYPTKLSASTVRLTLIVTAIKQ